MTTSFHAQPYDTSATGFYFETASGFEAKIAKAINDYGEHIDCALFSALGIHQGNICQFIEKLNEWDERQKQLVILAVGEIGAIFDLANDDPDDLDIDIYEMNSLRDLAIEFVDEGLFGDIPERLQFYIDYDAIARDLSMDYSETEIARTRLIYRSA